MMSTKTLLLLGFFLSFVVAVKAHRSCPKTYCKKECDIEKENQVGLQCCSRKKCCMPCVEDEDCRCRDECIADAEVEDGLCKCGANKGKKCCKACIDVGACQVVPGASCKYVCAVNEIPIFGCCGGIMKCCVPCGTCDNSPDSTCVTKVATCPVDFPFALGVCCKAGTNMRGKCCGRVPKCGLLSINGSSNPFSCKLPSDDSCGPPFEQYVQEGYCCVPELYCCPECGWDCVNKANGDRCTDPMSMTDVCPVDKVIVENNDCCERGGFTQCCAP